MLSLRNILFESEYSHLVVNNDFALDWILKNFNPRATLLYRGIESDYNEDILFIKGNSYKRDEPNTTNHFNTLIDNLDAWKEYPKRLMSVIGSINYNYSEDYGTVYYLIPKVGSKIGICPTRDMFESFNNFFLKMESIILPLIIILLMKLMLILMI